MRKPSDRTVGERELFAAFVSYQNQCMYCVGDHKAIAACALNKNVIEDTLKNWRTSAVTPQLRATLGMLETLITRPDTFSKAQIDLVREAGVRDEAIEDAINVCAAFSVINRLADAFDFTVPKNADRVGRLLFTAGYNMSSLRG